MSTQKAKAGRPVGDWDEQKTRVSEATWRVIARDGMEKTSLRAIALEYGGTTGVLSHYFKNKRELLLFAASDGLERLNKGYREALSRRPLRQGLSAMAQTVLPNDAASHTEWLVYLSFLSQTTNNPDFAEEIQRWRLALRGLIRDALRNAIDRGEISDDLEIEIFVDQLQSLVEGMGLLSLGDRAHFNPERQLQIFEAFLGNWFVPPEADNN